MIRFLNSIATICRFLDGALDVVIPAVVSLDVHFPAGELRFLLCCYFPADSINLFHFKVDFTEMDCALPVRSAAVEALNTLCTQVDVGDYAGKVQGKYMLRSIYQYDLVISVGRQTPYV